MEAQQATYGVVLNALRLMGNSLTIAEGQAAISLRAGRITLDS